MTFIYTAQIQLYSFQLLKITRMNNYLIYKEQHYIRKSFFKKASLQITFKNFKIGGASKI